jgi:hypothetical protein
MYCLYSLVKEPFFCRDDGVNTPYNPLPIAKNADQ